MPIKFVLNFFWNLWARIAYSFSRPAINKVSQSGWLKTTKIYSFSFRSLKSKHWDVCQATLPLEVLGENSSLPLSAPGVGLWHHHSNMPLYSHVFSATSLCILSSVKELQSRTLVFRSLTNYICKDLLSKEGHILGW